MQASAGIAKADMSVRLSVRLCVTLRYFKMKKAIASMRHDFFTIGQPKHSSFWKYLVHPEIRKRSPQARAIYETGVGTNWRFWRFFDQ